MPSAVAGRTPRPPRSNHLRTVAITAAAIVLLVGLAGFAGSRLLGGEALRQQAERALSDIARRELAVRFGASGLSLADGSLVSFVFEDAAVGDEDGGDLLQAGSLSFGLRLLPLLRGEAQLSSATLSDARIDLARPGSGAASLPLDIVDEHGLVDPELLSASVFDALRAAVAALGAGQTETLLLERVQLVIGTPSRPIVVELAEARLRRTGEGTFAIDASATFEGRQLDLAAQAVRGGEAAIESIEIALTATAAQEDGEGLLPPELGPVSLRLTGSEGAGGLARLSAEAKLQIRPEFAQADQDAMEADVRLGYGAGGRQVEIEALEVVSGASSWSFAGTVEPVSTGAPRYAFQLAANAVRIAPADSPEQPIEAAALLGGSIAPDLRRVEADLLRVETASGTVDGRFAILLDGAGAPGIELLLAVNRVSTAEVKQLWPWFAAREARAWVHRNLSEGLVDEGSIELSMAPGRLDDDRPLGGEEVSGRFSVSGIRIEAPDEVPAIEDGSGEVTFAGTDLEVALDSGHARLPSGAELIIGGGSFVARDAHDDDAVGQLDIDVSGTASAIVELATLEPIDAGRYLDLAADRISGHATGKFLAEIPISGDVARDDFTWMAMLDYTGVSFAGPFNGHTVEDAEGSITVDPERVVVDAQLRLDGMQARLHLVEPLDGSGEGGSQDVQLVVDDATRDQLMPGLAAILSGSAAVQLSDGDGRREIGIDLASASVNLPWMGWSKGIGVPASASFVMERSEAAIRLERFAMRGDSFSVTGRLALSAEGGLSSAEFDRVRLNRNDDFALNVNRAGSGYRVGVSGPSLDARPLIRQLTADSASAASSVEDVPVTVELQLDRIVGFHDEAMHDVSLSYRGTGATIEGLEFSARTASGQAVVFRQQTADGRRSIAMQSADAGAVLRFLDLYELMEGGRIELALSAQPGQAMVGQLDARDFWVVGEPRLASLVSTPPQGDSRSLSQAVNRDIDVSRAFFDRGYAIIHKGDGWLALDEGVLRGPAIGSTFRGTLYDRAGNIDMSGTFMPAYGINRLFGEIPLFGQILGNGRDGGLIGITFRLAGKAAEPQLQINPLSAIAPGIFRSVFEFR